jgi:hypothetical protein
MTRIANLGFCVIYGGQCEGNGNIGAKRYMSGVPACLDDMNCHVKSFVSSMVAQC